MECPICLDIINEKCITNCNHSFCYHCLDNWFKQKKINCPICRVPIHEFIYQDNNYKIYFIENIRIQPRYVYRSSPQEQEKRPIWMFMGFSFIMNIILSVCLLECKNIVIF